MRVKLLVAFFLSFLVGCASTGNVELPELKPLPCSIYSEFGATPENSLIAAKIKDPCIAKTLITAAIALPAIEWQDKYIKEYRKWSSGLKTVLYDGVTYSELVDVFGIATTKLNVKAGKVIIVISDDMGRFTETGPLKQKDTELLLGLIEHIDKKINLLEAME